MKVALFLVLVGLALSYNPSAAVNYAKAHCKSYNYNYNTYPGADCANFVSQCLIAGGLSLSGCDGLDNKGAIPYVPNLINCIKKKGWSGHGSRPSCFKAGYPFFMNAYQHAMLALSISGNSVYYAGHTRDRCGEIPISSGVTYYC